MLLQGCRAHVPPAASEGREGGSNGVRAAWRGVRKTVTNTYAPGYAGTRLVFLYDGRTSVRTGITVTSVDPIPAAASLGAEAPAQLHLAASTLVDDYSGLVRQTTGFARMPDGGRIAFAVVGSGPALVMPAWWVSNVVEDWRFDPFRRFVEGLAAERTVVRYDRVGTGVSDRERPQQTFTPDFEAATLGAVLDELELERVTLLGISCGGCVAVSFAARWPERVDRLVLYGTYADGHALGPAAARAGMVDIVRSHWGLGSRLLADVFGPSWSPENRAAFTAAQRASANAQVAASLLELIYDTDVREDLPKVRAPALVVHREHDRAMRLTGAREVAALLPRAELVTLPGDAHLPWHGDVDAVLRAVAPFLGIKPPPAPARELHADALAELSKREREVLGLVAQGLSDAQVADRLVISPHTVHRHVANILSKLQVPTRAAAAADAARAGLL
jgi:pimeloyl-ACP methyl ester carboxylesterase/DNA-binding CsgD family transcriptional regulator